MQNIISWINKGHNIAFVTFGFTILFTLCYGIYLSLDYKYKKIKGIKYTGIRFNTKTITYISMMVAVSVSVTVVISITLPITAFPPVRIAFEGVMVKITGLMFGPVVGIIVGLVTETLTLMFVPSYIHISFLLVILSFGVWAGFVGYFINLKGKRSFITFGVLNIYMVVFSIVIFFLIDGSEMKAPFGVEALSGEFTKWLFIIVMAFLMLVSWIIVFLSMILKKQKLMDTVMPIFLLCIVCETLSTVLLGSWGDSAFLAMPESAGGYPSMVMWNLVETPLRVLFNILIITTVYTVLKPLIKVRLND